MPVSPNDPRLNKIGFAKLSGPGMNYYIKKYEITMGRRSKSTDLDVVLGDHMNISRKHALIKYDFGDKCWVIRALGKNGVTVNGKLVVPSKGPHPLSSQDLIEIFDHAFYFLLPKPGAVFPAKLPTTSYRKRKQPTADDEPVVKSRAARGKRRKQDEQDEQPNALPHSTRTSTAVADRPKTHQGDSRPVSSAAAEEYPSRVLSRAGAGASFHSSAEEREESDDGSAGHVAARDQRDESDEEDEGEAGQQGEDDRGRNGHMQDVFDGQSYGLDDEDEDEDDFGGYSNGD